MAIRFKVGTCSDDCICSSVPEVLSEAQTGDVGVYYQYDIEVWNGTAWVGASTIPCLSFGVGTIPPGLTFNYTTGTLYGTPTEEWDGEVSLVVESPCGTGYGTLALTIGPGGCSFFAGDLIFSDSNTYDWTAVNAVDREIAISVINYADCDTVLGGGGDLGHYFSIEIQTNLALLYFSGCIKTNLSTTVTVPAGVTYLRIDIVAPCSGHAACESGGGGEWYVECV